MVDWVKEGMSLCEEERSKKGGIVVYNFKNLFFVYIFVIRLKFS